MIGVTNWAVMKRRKNRREAAIPVTPSCEPEEARKAKDESFAHLAEAQQMNREVRKVKDSYLTQLGLSFGRHP